MCPIRVFKLFSQAFKRIAREQLSVTLDPCQQACGIPFGDTELNETARNVQGEASRKIKTLHGWQSLFCGQVEQTDTFPSDQSSTCLGRRPNLEALGGCGVPIPVACMIRRTIAHQ
jgi:hypothetical protein